MHEAARGHREVHRGGRCRHRDVRRAAVAQAHWIERHVGRRGDVQCVAPVAPREVGARQACDTDAALAFLNGLDQPAHGLCDLVVIRRFDENVKVPRNDSQRRENHAVRHGSFGCGAIGALH